MLKKDPIEQFTEEYLDAMSLLAEGVNVMIGDTTLEKLQAWVNKTSEFLNMVLDRHEAGTTDETPT